MCSDNLYPCVVKCPSRKVLDAHCRNQKVVASSQHTFQEKITMKIYKYPNKSFEIEAIYISNQGTQSRTGKYQQIVQKQHSKLENHKAVHTAKQIKIESLYYEKEKCLLHVNLKQHFYSIVKKEMKRCLQWIYGLNLDICRKQLAFFRKNLSLLLSNRIQQLYVLCYLLINTKHNKMQGCQK